MAAKLKGGSVLGKWKLGRCIGWGGQGEVWEVRLTTGAPGPPRAMKVCLAAEQRPRSRFETEVALLTQLTPTQHVVPVLDSELLWNADAKTGLTYAFYVTERFDHSLDGLRWLQRASFLSLELFRELCDAVQSLHVRAPRLIHRDIKPSNIFLGSEPYRLALGDLGIAYEETDAERVTEVHEVVGSQHYRAPEILMGNRGDERSDIYSLGRTLEWILTGRTPDLPNPREIPSSSGFSPAARTMLDAVIRTACASSPDARYQTVAQLKSAIPPLHVDIGGSAPARESAADATFADGAEAYSAAKSMLSRRDTVGWREAAKTQRKAVHGAMLAWRAQLERNVPHTVQQGENALDDILGRIAPVLGTTLACAEHPDLALGDPLQVLRDVLAVAGWQLGGWTRLVESPTSVAFAIHHLIGATASAVGNQPLVAELANLQVDALGRCLIEDGAITTWPGLMDGGANRAWHYLKRLPVALPWVTAVLGDDFDWRVSLLAYRWQLSFFEFAKWAAGEAEPLNFVRVPPVILQEEPSDLARAFTLAIPNRRSLESICAHAQIGVPRAREKWSEWLDILRKVGQSSLPNVWMRLERNALPQLPQ